METLAPPAPASPAQQSELWGCMPRVGTRHPQWLSAQLGVSVQKAGPPPHRPQAPFHSLRSRTWVHRPALGSSHQQQPHQDLQEGPHLPGPSGAAVPTLQDRQGQGEGTRVQAAPSQAGTCRQGGGGWSLGHRRAAVRGPQGTPRVGAHGGEAGHGGALGRVRPLPLRSPPTSRARGGGRDGRDTTLPRLGVGTPSLQPAAAWPGRWERLTGHRGGGRGAGSRGEGDPREGVPVAGIPRGRGSRAAALPAVTGSLGGAARATRGRPGQSPGGGRRAQRRRAPHRGPMAGRARESSGLRLNSGRAPGFDWG